jgi:translation initiation factor IF-1
LTKEDLLKIDGEVEEVLPNGMFRVNINGNTIITYISGKVRKNKISIIRGDKVAVEVSAYDLTKGRIVYRYK